MQQVKLRTAVKARDLRNFWRDFSANKLGLIGLAILIVFFFIAAFSPWLAPFDPTEIRAGPLMGRPSELHIFGTDQLGRDIFSRVLYGTRLSLLVGLSAAAIAVVVGTLVGLVSGYYGKASGEALMRLTDLFLVMPFLPLVMVLATLLGRSLFIIMVVIGITSWPWMARVIRSEVLSLKQRAFVERARAIGCSNTHIIRKHILPNTLPLVTANAILIIPVAIMAEASLAFIGLGDPLTISWGSILEGAFTNNAITLGLWHWFIPPGLGIVFLSLGFALVGHVIDEVVNPRLRKKGA